MSKVRKMVNVILNSNNKLPLSDPSNNAIADFFIDWGAILKPNTPYTLHWVYVGQNNSFGSNIKTAGVYVDFQTETYLNRSSNYGAPSTQMIGSLRRATNFLFADDNSNPPIYLQNRPNNNNFRVSILNNDATPTPWIDQSSESPGNWVLTLSFHEIDMDD